MTVLDRAPLPVQSPALGRRGLMGAGAAALGLSAASVGLASPAAATVPSSTANPLPATDLARLKRLARAAQARAYAPYSGYHVGGSLLTIDGEFYRGTGNIENSNYTLTIHGEQTAITEAVSQGSVQRVGAKFIKAIYLTTALLEGQRYECLPCGGCRQSTAEMAATNGQWVIEQTDGSVKYYPFDVFLPFPYSE